MIRELTHSRFTPSLLTHEALEAIFVRRGKLAERLLDLIRESATTGNKHFVLLHGPRGIGKTHLVSLIHGRVQEDVDLSEKLCIAWLCEEEWGVASYVDLLRVILRTLHEKYDDEALAQANEDLPKLGIDAAELEAEKLLLQFVEDKTLLILTENVDEIFEGLETKGQKKFRALIQNNPIFTIIATARGLFEGVEQREAPFYGFFNPIALDEFSADDATELLRKIAQQEKDPELANLLGEPQGRARIRALHYLAGGNPRVYVIFSQFLTRESLDSLVAAVMNTLDDLTSYYQERMARLTPQQRKIVQFLCDQRGAPTVKVIAENNFITHQTTSGQLKKLRELGYVRSEQRGRESYYELKEPLMRIALGVKKHRGEPLGLLVEFLRLWYTRDELKRKLETLAPEMALERSYITHAIRANEGHDNDPVISACLRDFYRLIESEDYETALQVTDDLQGIRNSAMDFIMRAVCLVGLEKDDYAVASLRHARAMAPDNPHICSGVAGIFASLKFNKEALEAYEKSIALDPNDIDTWLAMGVLLGTLGNEEKALSAFDRALELDKDKPAIWHNRGFALLLVNRAKEALESFDKAIELDPEQSTTWNVRGLALGQMERHEEALESFEKALSIGPNVLEFQRNRGFALVNLRRMDEAATAFGMILASNPNSARDWFHKGDVLSMLERPEEALESYSKAIQLAPDERDFWIAHGMELVQLGRFEDSLHSLEKANEIDPDALLPWRVRGILLWQLDRLEESRSALAQWSALSENDADPWRLLAEAHSVLGQQDEALQAFERAFEIEPNIKDFSALSHRAVALMLSGKWEDGVKELDSALYLISNNSNAGESEEIEIVQNMLLRTRDSSVWRKHFPVWIELFKMHGVLSSLGQGVVQSIQSLQISWINYETAQAWYDTWQELAGDHKELKLPLRLLGSAVEYLAEEDDRVLFKLPIEERRLLEPLIGIER